MTGWKPVPPFKFKWNDDSHPGWLVRWLSPGDYHAIAIDPSDSKARFYKRENDGLLTTLATDPNHGGWIRSGEPNLDGWLRPSEPNANRVSVLSRAKSSRTVSFPLVG